MVMHSTGLSTSHRIGAPLKGQQRHGSAKRTAIMSTSTDQAAASLPKSVQAPLLDDEGDLTPKFESALIRIFARFSTPYKKSNPEVQAFGSKSSTSIPRPDSSDVLTEADLDAFSTVTNGSALPQESKDEIREFLDTDKDGNLTLRGFIEMYHLQSDNEPEETWKDLSKLGFGDDLEYEGGEKESKEHEEAKESSTTVSTGSKD
ncbi:hypothetical protein PHSY_003247 [Pseudozyma hubeiensis SY62]|uniref:EF-hand domain-containing protein n=1 Tax=Pseudozyma hubeiensis (strain SY62) TaxID=1305764 RepID=R9P2V2_PSEHS|nr:hypothetical protein PHSY_003247 [Pseudozyma hubeiensis SY62]GAC95671.1 hypothetical protein PHSY_003247 [Pseudozyma hubeiensis SY62]